MVAFFCLLGCAGHGVVTQAGAAQAHTRSPSTLSVEERHFEVILQGAPIGFASLSAEPRGDGTVVHRATSVLASTRDPGVQRYFRETVVSREGRFVAAERRLAIGPDEDSSRARATVAGIEVERGPGSPHLLPSPARRMIWAQMDAYADLVHDGGPGDARAIFDPATGSLGEVLLLERASGGWVVLEELGMRMRLRWSEGALLPDEIVLEGVGLRYVGAMGPRQDIGASRPASRADEERRAVPLWGEPRLGSELRLEPPEAFPGLSCPRGLGTLTAAGPVCDARDVPLTGLAHEAGPLVRRLAAEVPADLCDSARARWLAEEIETRLAGPPSGSGLFESTAEQALASGAGDCNEAAAVFMAAAPLLGLEARRRTGLLVAGGDGRKRWSWPHAWVEVRLGGSWVRADPGRGQVPALGVYVDLGDGDSLSARLRTMGAAASGGTITVVEP